MKQKVTFREKYDDLFSKRKAKNEKEKIIPGCMVPSVGFQFLYFFCFNAVFVNRKSDYIDISVSGYIFKIQESRNAC